MKNKGGKMKQLREEFQDEIEILKDQVDPEELFVLGYLKGNRNEF
jgi:hypothetical protein